MDIPSTIGTEKKTGEKEMCDSSENFPGHAPIISSSDFQLGVEIGRGDFGAVYKGSWLGTDVAIKKLSIGKKGKGKQLK